MKHKNLLLFSHFSGAFFQSFFSSFFNFSSSVLNPKQFQLLFRRELSSSFLCVSLSADGISKHLHWEGKYFSCLIFLRFCLSFYSRAPARKRHLRLFTFQNCFWESSGVIVRRKHKIVRIFSSDFNQENLKLWSAWGLLEETWEKGKKNTHGFLMFLF